MYNISEYVLEDLKSICPHIFIKYKCYVAPYLGHFFLIKK